MGQLSVGFQAGGKAYSEIIFFEDKRALDEFDRVISSSGPMPVLWPLPPDQRQCGDQWRQRWSQRHRRGCHDARRLPERHGGVYHCQKAD